MRRHRMTLVTLCGDSVASNNKGVMNKLGILLMFAASLSFAQTAQIPGATVQLTPLPPKPTCDIILRNGACADLGRSYNQAGAQRVGEQKKYANRQAQMEAAPLQQQVSDLTKLTTDERSQIKSLQEQMQSDSTTALQAKVDAHTIGLQEGIGWGVGAMLLLVGVVFGITKLSQGFAIPEKEQAKAASA
jgi:hypothetical protein